MNYKSSEDIIIVEPLLVHHHTKETVKKDSNEFLSNKHKTIDDKQSENDTESCHLSLTDDCFDDSEGYDYSDSYGCDVSECDNFADGYNSDVDLDLVRKYFLRLKGRREFGNIEGASGVSIMLLILVVLV